MEIGVYTFAELQEDPLDGHMISPEQRMRDLIEEAELAEQVGLDVFGVGEHHRDDLIVSSPAVVLAAIAARTERLRLTSAVSVISSDDPVRVFQDFATVDLLSGGRAEIMAGRGSFTESFPLFGYDLDDYDALFDEKLRLLLARTRGRARDVVGALPPGIRRSRACTRGRSRILCRSGSRWAGRRSRRSARARWGCRWRSRSSEACPNASRRSSQLFRDAAREAGHDPIPPVSINSHGYIAATEQEALDDSYPYAASMMNRIGRERGWQPMHARALRRGRHPARRELRRHAADGDRQDPVPARAVPHDRFLVQFTVGSMPHAKIMRSIELLGTEVAPAVRAELGIRSS